MDIDAIRASTDAAQAAQSVTYTGTAGVTTGWNPGPRSVWVWSSTDSYVAVGESVTATTSDLPIPANTPVLMHVPRGVGATWRVSAIQVAAGGTVYAKPVA